MPLAWAEHSRLIEQMAAVVAILLALGHSLELRRQLKKVKQVATQLQGLEAQLTEKVARGVQEIREALPTKRLGKFPSFLDKIVELIDSAEREILIICDYPAYGSFSAPDRFLDYRRAIEDKTRDKKRVSIACLGPDARERELGLQEDRDDSDWSSYKAARRTDFDRYLEIHAQELSTDHLTVQQFKTLILEEDDSVLDTTFHGTRRHELNQKPPVYVWLIDNESMIFVVPSASRPEEQGFYTQDSHLIASFKDIVRATSPELTEWT